jgi:hypothetical protein
MKRSSLSIRKISPKGRDHFYQKALRRTPSKSANIAGFQLPILTNVIGEDSSRPPAGKIYYPRIGIMRRVFIPYSAVQFRILLNT